VRGDEPSQREGAVRQSGSAPGFLPSPEPGDRSGEAGEKPGLRPNDRLRLDHVVSLVVRPEKVSWCRRSYKTFVFVTPAES